MATRFLDSSREAKEHVRTAGLSQAQGLASLVRAPADVAVRWAVLVALWLLAALVFWAFDALPYQDLPAHAGLIALRQRYIHSVFDQRYFVLASHVGPYTLFRVLGECASVVVGPVGAVRFLGMLPVLTLPFATMFARKHLHLHGKWDPSAGFFGLVLSFGFMTILGFASFLLGLSVLIFALPFWFRVLKRGLPGPCIHQEEHETPAVAIRNARKDAIRLCGVLLLLFIAHGHAFVLFLAIALTSAIVARPKLRVAYPFVPAVLLAARGSCPCRLRGRYATHCNNLSRSQRQVESAHYANAHDPYRRRLCGRCDHVASCYIPFRKTLHGANACADLSHLADCDGSILRELLAAPARHPLVWLCRRTHCSSVPLFAISCGWGTSL
jgi:hypothetical protein